VIRKQYSEICKEKIGLLENIFASGLIRMQDKLIFYMLSFEHIC